MCWAVTGDEERLTAAIIKPVTKYERSGGGRFTTRLSQLGWLGNRTRLERIGRCEV
jgi:hypothetical protein